MAGVTESTIEHATLEWFKSLGYAVLHGSVLLRVFVAIRDALLPRLLSGELRVRDAGRFLKETARC